MATTPRKRRLGDALAQSIQPPSQAPATAPARSAADATGRATGNADGLDEGEHRRTSRGYVTKDGTEKVRVSVMLTKAERRWLRNRAEDGGQSVSDYVRAALGIDGPAGGDALGDA